MLASGGGGLVGGDGDLGNRIVGNTGAAVEVTDGESPTVEGNVMIGNNGGIMIDPGDKTRIPLAPTITTATHNGPGITVTGNITDLIPSNQTTARVDAYGTTTCTGPAEANSHSATSRSGPITDGSFTLTTPTGAPPLPLRQPPPQAEANGTSRFTSCFPVK